MLCYAMTLNKVKQHAALLSRVRVRVRMLPSECCMRVAYETVIQNNRVRRVWRERERESVCVG